MTGVVVVAVGSFVLGAVLAVAFLRGACRQPARRLGEIEQQVTWLRREVTDHRAAHEHSVMLIHRRLEALEEVTARAANEFRMASERLLARLPGESPADVDTGERHGS